MSASTDFVIKVLGDTSNAKKVVDEFGDGLGKAASGWGSTFRNVASTAGGVLAALGIERIADKAVEFGRQSVDAYKEAEESQALLVQAYEKFPAIADVSISKLRELNTALQAKTGYDDDQIASSQATLAQFELTGDQVERLTPLMLDYAAKTGSDLPTAAENLGKAVLGQGRALKSIGVEFTDTGTAAGNFDQLMGALGDKVGGTAEALGKTGAGQARILDATFGDLQETVGERLLPAVVFFQGFLVSSVIPTLADVTTGVFGVFDVLSRGDFTGAANTFGWAEDSAPVDMLFQIRDGLISLAQQTAPVFEGLFTAISPLWPALADLGGLLATAVAETGVSTWTILLDIVTALTPILGGLAIAISGIVSWLGENQWLVNAIVVGITAWTVAQWALNAALTANPIGIIVMAIAALVGGIVWLATQTTFFQDIWTGTTAVIGAAWAWLWNTALSPVFSAIGAAFGWIYNTIILPVVTGIMLYIGLWAAAVSWLWSNVISPIFGLIGGIFGWIWGTVISPTIDWISDKLNLLGLGFQLLWAGFVQPALDGIGAGLNWVWVSIISPVFSAISGAAGWVGQSIRDAFGGLGDFIGAAFNAALSVVRGPVNGIIGLVNSAIRGLNTLSVTIPAWVPMVGGQTWGLSIPTIPMLAQGTVTNGPMFALIGDNPGGREVVAPYDAYVDEIRRAAGVSAGAGTSSSAGPVRLAREDLDYLAEKLSGGLYDSIRLGSKRAVTTALRG